MPSYKRYFRPGGTYFLTLVTYERRPLFGTADRVAVLRGALAEVRRERTFGIDAAVALPDYIHFVWTLPEGDTAYPARIGRLKILVTRALRAEGVVGAGSEVASRDRHREADVWQRRYWEHTVRDIEDLEGCIDYVHHNPVKHGHVACPHRWPYSSFSTLVSKRVYPPDWMCRCADQTIDEARFDQLAGRCGE